MSLLSLLSTSKPNTIKVIRKHNGNRSKLNEEILPEKMIDKDHWVVIDNNTGNPIDVDLVKIGRQKHSKAKKANRLDPFRKNPDGEAIFLNKAIMENDNSEIENIERGKIFLLGNNKKNATQIAAHIVNGEINKIKERESNVLIEKSADFSVRDLSLKDLESEEILTWRGSHKLKNLFPKIYSRNVGNELAKPGD